MDANEGVRRRLPSWMLGGQAGSKSEASNVNGGDDVKECNENEEKVGKRSRVAKPKVQKEGNRKGKASLKKPSVSVLVRKRGKRQVTPDDDDDEISLDDEFYDEFPRKKRNCRKKDKIEIETDDDEFSLDNEFHEEAPRKKRNCRKKDKIEIEADDDEISLDDELHVEAPRKKRNCRKKDKIEIETDKDVKNGSEDLTVEDLVSIAKEYVEEDKKGPRYIAAGNQSRDANVGSFEDRGTSSSSMAEKSTSDTGPKPAVTSSMSMLDLMLGPLYKKTQEQEKEKKLNLEYASFKYEEIKQPSSAAVVGEPVAVPKKKKSSLKDMVAMYLD